MRNVVVPKDSLMTRLREWQCGTRKAISTSNVSFPAVSVGRRAIHWHRPGDVLAIFMSFIFVGMLWFWIGSRRVFGLERIADWLRRGSQPRADIQEWQPTEGCFQTLFIEAGLYF